MRITVILSFLIVCTLPLASARRKLKPQHTYLKDQQRDMCIVKIERSVEDTGYHRELVTHIKLDPDEFLWCIFNDRNTRAKQWTVCNVHIQENLPASIYVDPYELESLEREENLRAYMHSEVDLELPRELAEPLTVDMFAADKWPAHDQQGFPYRFEYTMRVPFHVRYHAPSDNATHHKVEIPPPANVGVRCQRPLHAYAPPREHYRLPAPHGVEIRKGLDTLATPQYLESYFATKSFIQLKGIPEEPIVIEVPVGEKRHKPLVSPVTSLVSISAVAIILLGIFRARQRMKNDANLRKAVETSLQEASSKKES